MFLSKSVLFRQKIWDEFSSFTYFSVARLLDLFTRLASHEQSTFIHPSSKVTFTEEEPHYAYTIAAQTPTGIVNLLRSRDKCSVHFARMLALSVNELELQ